MNSNYNYKLIDGIFQPSEAKKVLLDLLNTKISYHKLDDFSNHIRFNTEISNSKNRIEELLKTSNAIKEIIELANQNGKQLKINSEIIIELIDNV